MFLRTAFICLMAGFAVFCTSFHVQADGERLIAVILIKDIPRYESIHRVFSDQLSLQSKQPYRLYVQLPNDDFMSLRNSIRKAVAIDADLIVVYGTKPALAAEIETIDTPVLFADVYDPVKLGLVSEDGRPKDSIIGIRGDGPLQTLVNAYLSSTQSKKIATFYNPKDPAGKAQVEIMKIMGSRKSFTSIPVAITKIDDFKKSFDLLAPQFNALLLTDSTLFAPALKDLLTIANNHQKAVLTQIPGAAQLGALMSFEHDPQEQGLELAKMASLVLSGTNASELRLVNPHSIHLTINLKVAKRLGITVPFDVLAMTSRVIR